MCLNSSRRFGISLLLLGVMHIGNVYCAEEPRAIQLPAATIAESYEFDLRNSNFRDRFEPSLPSGTLDDRVGKDDLPPGLNLGGSAGLIYGIVSRTAIAKDYDFRLTVSKPDGTRSETYLMLKFLEPGFGANVALMSWNDRIKQSAGDPLQVAREGTRIQLGVGVMGSMFDNILVAVIGSNLHVKDHRTYFALGVSVTGVVRKLSRSSR